MKDLLQNLIQLQTLDFGDVKTGAVEAARAALRSRVPAPILGHYDRLVARGKKGVAAVRGQVCSACHMQVPLAVVMRLQHGLDLQLCENCGRYLCLPAEGESEVANPVPPPKPARKTRKSSRLVQKA